MYKPSDLLLQRSINSRHERMGTGRTKNIANVVTVKRGSLNDDEQILLTVVKCNHAYILPSPK